MQTLPMAITHELGRWALVAAGMFLVLWAAGDVYLWLFCGRPGMLWIFPLFQWVAP